MIAPTAAVTYRDLRPSAQSFGDAVAEGLGRVTKSIPSQFFYDDRGSELFERICQLEAYYPTRTEIALLRERRDELCRLMGRGCAIVEFGCGSSLKIRALLDAARDAAAYIAIDISKSALISVVRDLAGAFPGLAITSICADYTAPLDLPELAGDRFQKKVGFFPGSNIGNFTPRQAEAFMVTAAAMVGPGGDFIVGVDRRKNKARLEAAYNDKDGVTALFNLNLLERINRELGGDIDIASFRHRAFYNDGEGRIEMHLESMCDQTITVGGREYRFVLGETIHTENSYKYEIADFQKLASRAGFEPVVAWSDEENLFSIHYLTVAKTRR